MKNSIRNKRKKRIAILLTAALISLLLGGCTSETDTAGATTGTKEETIADQETLTMQPHEATQEEVALIQGRRTQAESGMVSSTVDQKFVNTKYLLTGLVNSDCVVEEDENGLLIYVPSENAVLQINLVPGIQNRATTVANLQNLVTTNYSQEGTGGTYESSLLGYQATVIPFTANVNDQVVNGFASALIANQSLYSINFMYYSSASANELDLLSKVLASLQVIKPSSVDTSTKKAVYTDPYAGYKIYDPYLYYYISGIWTYEDYLAMFTDYYETVDLLAWEELPYFYYSWYEGDYSGFTEADFAADYNYYDDSTYWSWGWDEAEDWSFYDTYAAYYDAAYYEELADYYEAYGEELEEYVDNESYDFSEEESTWEDIELETYDDTSYEYDDYYDDYYYSDDSSAEESYDDSSYDDSSYDDSSYDDSSYDDSSYDDSSYDDSSYEE